jgi:hypothetical protein
MNSLFLIHARQLFRSRLFYLSLGLCFLTHWAGLKLFQGMTVKLPGQLSMGPLLKAEHLPFLMVFLQWFVGSFIATAMGFGFVAYWHKQNRPLLWYTLPIARWKWPLSYVAFFAVFSAVIHLLALLIFIWIVGVGPLKADGNISSLLAVSGYELLVFEVLMLLLAVGIVWIGPMLTLFGSLFLLFISQLNSVLGRVEWFRTVISESNQKIWDGLNYLIPPFGEVPFQLWVFFKDSEGMAKIWFTWSIWFIL